MTTTQTTTHRDLIDAETNEVLGAATPEQAEASDAEIERGNYAGIITVDGRAVYVSE